MIKNNIKQLLRNNTPVINGWLSIDNSFTAEIMSAQDYDSITIDTQHGVVDHTDVANMLQAIGSADKITPMVRVPWLDAGIIMKMLDLGAYGIICPMINNREQAEQLVSYMRYPPLGVRSFGPIRAKLSAGDNYSEQANDELICLAMVETKEAMDNLTDIVTTPGLDGIYIGPADLTLSLTGSRLAAGFDREEEEMIAVIKEILSAAKIANIYAGIHCGSPEYAAKAIGWGFDLVTTGSDARLMESAAAAGLKTLRQYLNQTPNKVTKQHSSGY